MSRFLVHPFSPLIDAAAEIAEKPWASNVLLGRLMPHFGGAVAGLIA